MDPGLCAIHAGVKITQFGAVGVGVKPHATWPMTPSWRWHDSHLGTVIIGAKLGAVVIGDKPGVMDLSVELLEFVKSGILPW
jgi:hypothetical protein